MIVALQIIMHKYYFSESEFELAFDCLIFGTFMSVKFLYHQIYINSNYLSDLVDRVLHYDPIAKATSILTNLILIYLFDGTASIQHVLITYIPFDDLYTILAKSIHHSHIDSTLD